MARIQFILGCTSRAAAVSEHLSHDSGVAQACRRSRNLAPPSVNAKHVSANSLVLSSRTAASCRWVESLASNFSRTDVNLQELAKTLLTAPPNPGGQRPSSIVPANGS